MANVDTQSKAVTAIMLAVGVTICGIIYSIVDVKHHAPTNAGGPWPYTTLPNVVPSITTPDEVIDLGNPFINLGPVIIIGPIVTPPIVDVNVPQPHIPPVTTLLPPTLLPPVKTPPLIPLIPPVQTPPVTIPVEGIDKSVCSGLPALCGTTALIDETVNGVTDAADKTNGVLAPVINSTTGLVNDTLDGVTKAL